MSRVETAIYLGPYRLLHLVYAGTSTQIWQAVHPGQHRYYALKTLLERYRREREYVGYLRWEYRVGQTLSHERIIQIYEFRSNRGNPFVAMEWFPAPSMRARIQQALAGIEQHIPKIILQATEAVAALNEQGWIHRDIKPDNFLVTDAGEVKLIDFALAYRVGGLLARWFARPPKVQGTRSYMSPEQIRGRHLDERSDLYSLACTFFHLLTGNPPFTGLTTNELLSKHLKAPPPPLEALNRNVTPEFAELLHRAMAKDPKQRPESASQFLSELRRISILRTRPTSAGQ